MHETERLLNDILFDLGCNKIAMVNGTTFAAHKKILKTYKVKVTDHVNGWKFLKCSNAQAKKMLKDMGY